MTDPRDLIQRLAPVVSALAEEYSGYSELAQEVRAYLAAPDESAVPAGSEPTDEELASTYWKAWHEYHDRTNSVLHAAGLRAVLARWGSRTQAPIPISERQPTEADCDTEGKCWWWHAESFECNACWCYSRGNGTEKLWLPSSALPVPGMEA